MKKKKSFLQTLRMLMRIQICLMTVVMTSFVVFAYHSAEERQGSELDAYLELFARQIENRMARTDECLSGIAFDNLDLELLRSDQENEREYAAIRLVGKLEGMLLVSESADVFTIAQVQHDVCVQAKVTSRTLGEQEELRAFALAYAANGSQTGAWAVLKTTGNIYLYRALLHNSQQAVIAYLDVDTLLGVSPGDLFARSRFFLTDGEGIVLGAVGENARQAVGSPVSQLSSGGVLASRVSLAGGGFSLYACQEKSEVFRQVSAMALVMFAVLFILWGFGLYFSAQVRRELLSPMKEMTQGMEHIKDGQYDLKITTASDSVEFQTLVDAFNRLIDEIVHLKLRVYEKKLALMEAEQKYIRSQLRPHFFLNAMSTIAGLSRAGQTARIETYITALSGHIRYMFSTGLRTVPVGEELRHLEDYFEMQELKYPGCVLYFIDTPEDVKDWPVPQMLVHTIVENEYKYAVSVDSQLMVLIKLCKVERNGEEMLLIEVEDDGKGFSPQVIAAVNGEAGGPKEDGSRVGLWSIRRLLELMYEREGLFEISNVEPHGAMNRLYIPAKAANERTPEGET